jgi:hypothetical protein
MDLDEGATTDIDYVKDFIFSSPKLEVHKSFWIP